MSCQKVIIAGLVSLGDLSRFLCADDAADLFFDDAPVEEMNRAVGVARITRVVCDHADGRAALMQFAQQVHYRLAVFGVEVSGRLVREQDQRLTGHSASDGDALLLTARQLTRQMLRAMRHADALKRIGYALLAFGARQAAISERQFDVLIDVQVADQIEALKDEADLAVAYARALRRRKFCDRPVVEPILAVGRRVQEAEDREQR